jgi:glycosyltransferase involved in cell wall biosynthesis
MRVLHINHRYWPYQGGSELYFQELSERLAALGHQVTVWTTDAWDLEHFWAAGQRRVGVVEETHNGVAIRRFPVRRPPLPPIYYRVLRRAMAEANDLPLPLTPLLRRAGLYSPWVPAMAAAFRALPPDAFDLVHASNITLESLILYAQAWTRRSGAPLVVTPFTHLGEPGSRAVRRYYTMRHQMALLKAAACVIVQTGLERDALAALGIAPARLERVGVGVNPAQLAGGEAQRFRTKYGITGPIVFTLGALAFDKGMVHLVEAMRRLWAAGPEATLVLAGSTTLRDFADYFTTVPAADRDRCRVLNFIPDEDKRDAFAACDVFAMPSRVETFGIVYLEAWLYDKPVIGAAAGGLPEVIADGATGYLVPFGDVAALADRITRLLADPALRARLGAAGHATVLREHTWDAKISQVRALYERLVAAGRSR